MAAPRDEVVVADRELDQLGRHRLALEVAPGRAPAVLARARSARRWPPRRCRWARRGGSCSSPCRSGGRSTGRRGGRGPAAPPSRCRRACRRAPSHAGVVGVGLGRDGHEVRHLDHERRRFASGRFGVITSSSSSRVQSARAAVDRHRADALAGEVEVEARQRLRRAREDRDRPVARSGPARSSRSAGRGRSGACRSRRCRAAERGGRQGLAPPARAGRPRPERRRSTGWRGGRSVRGA